ncbi:MAG: TonB-dependent receptor, partial [Candidatus Aminicenantes bacterium]|nr:TonB-dependent receptor [Candidatus Aminicenantes bacterium]
KEEKSYSMTFGIDFGRQINNKLFRFSFSGFYNRLNDVFTLDEVESDKNYMVMERFNSDGAKVFGIELESGFKIADTFEIFTGWTFQRNEYDTPEPDFDSKKMFKTPELYGSLRIEWNIQNFLSINTEMTYTGSMKIPHYAGFISDDILEESDPFVVINMSLNKKIILSKIQSITLTASALNIFDDFQKDLDKGVYRDAGYIYGPRFPRTFRLGIKYNF